MISPTTLLTEIQSKLKLIPSLSSVVVEIYDRESEMYRNLNEAIDSNQYPTVILVAYEGGVNGREGETRGTQHDFQLILISQCNLTTGTNVGYFELLDSIYNGIPSDGSEKFSELSLTNCEPFYGFEHRIEQTGDEIEIWRVRFSTIEL